MVTTFCTYLHNNKIFKILFILKVFSISSLINQPPLYIGYCEGMYKKFWPPFLGPYMGPFEGALCHSWWTPRKIIIFTGQLCLWWRSFKIGGGNLKLHFGHNFLKANFFYPIEQHNLFHVRSQWLHSNASVQWFWQRNLLFGDYGRMIERLSSSLSKVGSS